MERQKTNYVHTSSDKRKVNAQSFSLDIFFWNTGPRHSKINLEKTNNSLNPGMAVIKQIIIISDCCNYLMCAIPNYER